jgi:hypothetical protein
VDEGWRPRIILSIAAVALVVGVAILAVLALRSISPGPRAVTTLSPQVVLVPSQTIPPPPTPSPDIQACSGKDPTANIYHPSRLVLLEPCITAIGTVLSIRAEPDGDLHIQLRLDPGQSTLLNRGNAAEQSGTLVVEIICFGTVTQQDAVTACANYSSPLLVPAVGTRIVATGPHVLDTEHDWMEIHPLYVWHSVP